MLALQGRRQGLEREQDERAWLAWHIAALGRTKHLPELEKLTARKRPKRAQTKSELIGALNALVIRTGGEIG